MQIGASSLIWVGTYRRRYAVRMFHRSTFIRCVSIHTDFFLENPRECIDSLDRLYIIASVCPTKPSLHGRRSDVGRTYDINVIKIWHIN